MSLFLGDRPLTTCALNDHLRRVIYKEPDAVYIQQTLPMMSTIWLETCRGIWKNIINKECIKLEHVTKFPLLLLTHQHTDCCSLHNICYRLMCWQKANSLAVMWLWLSAVLHYSWLIIRLIALHWKEGWTDLPPQPTYSREGVKCCD